MRHLLALLLALTFAGALAQPYPSRPIRIVAPFPASGGVDLSARVIGQKLSERFGTSVVIDNRPGAGGILGTDIVAKAPADGYSLLLNGSSHWIGPFVEKVSYDPVADFAAVSLVDRTPVILVVHPSLPVGSVKQLVALAKARPGQLNFSSGAPGSSNYIGGMLFNHYAKVDIVRIPYKGSAQGLTALMSGETQVMFASPGVVTSQLKSERLRALAVGSAQRSELARGLPTIAESGIPGYVCETLHAVFAPAGTPAAVVTRLHQEIDRFLKSADGKSQFLKGGVEAASSTPQQLTATMKSEMATIGKILKAAGVTPP